SIEMNITTDEWYKSIFRSSRKIAIPLMTHPGIELIGATVFDVVTNGTIHYKAIEALHRSSRSAAATMAMDLTVEAEALGCKIHFETNNIPTVSGKLIHRIDEVNKMKVPEPDASERLCEYLKAAETTAKKIQNIPVFSGCIGPFSLAGRLLDMTEIMTGIYIHPGSVHLLIQKCTSFLTKYIQAYKSLGVHGIIMAEPAAGLLGEEECNMFSSSYIKKIIDELQDENFMFILHNCGHHGNLAKSMESTGAKALHFGNAADMLYVLKTVSRNILVMGNIDPVNVLQTKEPEFVKTKTRELLEIAKDFPNFILSSGCDMPPGVPQENIEAFFDALNAFNIENVSV
ncbi:MAG: uroporphyrinogen decarboxylase family protein, partial [Prolixibacteraceae bacterium]|nr:uroporphyrinogen decarboxylase family protein [Prolixibacteraceae bacterium]